MNAFLMFPSGGIPLEMLTGEDYDSSTEGGIEGKANFQLNGVNTFLVTGISAGAEYGSSSGMEMGSYGRAYLVSGGKFVGGIGVSVYKGYNDVTKTSYALIPADSDGVSISDDFILSVGRLSSYPYEYGSYIWHVIKFS